ncbi:MAG: glutaminyl-peptide cyclotransferase [Bacteroidales bacterium]
MIRIKLNITLLVLIATSIISCNNKKQEESNNTEGIQEKINKSVSVIEILSPKNNELFTVGDEIIIDIALKNVEIIVDSVIVETITQKEKLTTDNLLFTWKTLGLNTGDNLVRIYAFSEGARIETYNFKLKLKSEITPELLECKIIQTFPHDTKSYTQGLIFEDDILYEGTGQYGQSVLRKTDFKTGNILAELSLPSQYFGEGITSFGDKIIQLTWTSRVGFVYDKKSFKLINTLQYDTQGWGLTTDGKQLIMSDGSSTIYFLDPDYFTQSGKIEIFDNHGPVNMINELEYIDGLIYANIYQTEEIIAFDPKSGKVIKRIDCRKIVPTGYKGEQDNVLNGIAFDKKNSRIFITGKRWPNLFEVKFVKQ